MGRRKIEIKAIKDDRNRSVTFLKRKGGLFKKAHELSVLCSVDVAVIIFGHNKKLYEFSSGDINETIGRYQYYGQPHEHKGPADYRDKNGGDSDDDDEDLSPPRDEVPQQHQGPPPQPHYPPHMPQHPFAPQIRHPAPSASPPVPQGMFQPRHGTPQPHPGSRPSSRNDARRMSSNLVQMQHPHATPPPPQQNGFSYVQNAGMYQQPNPNVSRPLPPQGTPPQQFHHFPHHPPPQQYQPPPPPSQHVPAHPPPQPRQLQQPHSYTEEAPRHGMPSTSESSERQHLQPVSQAQQHQPIQQARRTPEPERRAPPTIKTDQEESPQSRPNRLSSKSRSIFTPIDERGSVLAQLFGFSEPREENKLERPATAATVPKPKAPTPPRAISHGQRTQSMPMPDVVPPSRASTTNSKGVGRGPRLTVQIPSEASDAESPADEGSPRQSGATEATPARGSSSSNRSSGVVLPPPSPSASAILSAGATGPPNPFARPPPREANLQNHNAYSGNNNIDTPISALPSRFVADNLLPSPSSFYPDWGFGRSGPDSNMLPSPLTFPTPIKELGPSFGKDNHGNDAATTGEKRKGSMDGSNENKKLRA